MKTKKIKHSEVCLEAYAGMGNYEEFICVDGCWKRSDAKPTSEASYTPGPWHTGSNGESGKGLAICSGGIVIAKVYGLGYPIGIGSHPESTANAHLIASAPELLAIVKEVRSRHHDSYGDELEKLIAKAEGK